MVEQAYGYSVCYIRIKLETSFFKWGIFAFKSSETGWKLPKPREPGKIKNFFL